MRVEAFSDGVFAIAITLLVLDLKVPRELHEGQRLLETLAQQWPAYAAFFTSFATIGVMWINHHRLFAVIRRVDTRLLLFNSLLLLGITVVPFPTAIVAEYIRGPEAVTAAVLYNVHGFNIALFFTLLWRHAAGRGHLLGADVDAETVERINRQYRFGPFLYLAGVALSFVSVHAALALDVALALFFAQAPQAPSRRATA